MRKIFWFFRNKIIYGLILTFIALSVAINAGEAQSKGLENSGVRFILIKCGMPILPYIWTEEKTIVPITLSYLGVGFHKNNLFVGTWGLSVYEADLLPFEVGVCINFPLVIKYEYRLKDNYYAYGLSEISLREMISKEMDDECISFSLGIVKKVRWTELGLNFRMTQYIQYPDEPINRWWYSLDVVYTVGKL